MNHRHETLVLSLLALVMCGGNDPVSETGDTEPGTTVVTGMAPTTGGETTGCILGSDGCACVDGLCLGDLVCHEGLCVTVGGTGTVATSTNSGNSEGSSSTSGATDECGATIYGSVSVDNSLQLEQLTGVRYITGTLTIAADLGPIPQLACLEEVKSLTVHPGNDCTAMQSLRVAESLMLYNGPGTIYPEFAELVTLEYLYLFDIDEILAFPQVSGLFKLALSGSSAPQFATDLAITLLFLSGGQGDSTTLNGVTVNYVDVVGYFGTSLPGVTVDTRLSVFDAPNLISLGVDFGSTFPAVPPATVEDESNMGIGINNTGLVNLDDLAGISIYTSRPGFSNNAALVDISGLEGATVWLSYDLPDNWAGMSIGSSPMLCLSHAEMVASTMTLPAAASFFGLNDGC